MQYQPLSKTLGREKVAWTMGGPVAGLAGGTLGAGAGYLLGGKKKARNAMIGAGIGSGLGLAGAGMAGSGSSAGKSPAPVTTSTSTPPSVGASVETPARPTSPVKPSAGPTGMQPVDPHGGPLSTVNEWMGNDMKVKERFAYLPALTGTASAAGGLERDLARGRFLRAPMNAVSNFYDAAKSTMFPAASRGVQEASPAIRIGNRLGMINGARTVGEDTGLIGKAVSKVSPRAAGAMGKALGAGGTVLGLMNDANAYGRQGTNALNARFAQDENAAKNFADSNRVSQLGQMVYQGAKAENDQMNQDNTNWYRAEDGAGTNALRYGGQALSNAGKIVPNFVNAATNTGSLLGTGASLTGDYWTKGTRARQVADGYAARPRQSPAPEYAGPKELRLERMSGDDTKWLLGTPRQGGFMYRDPATNNLYRQGDPVVNAYRQNVLGVQDEDAGGTSGGSF